MRSSSKSNVRLARHMYGAFVSACLSGTCAARRAAGPQPLDSQRLKKVKIKRIYKTIPISSMIFGSIVFFQIVEVCGVEPQSLPRKQCKSNPLHPLVLQFKYSVFWG